MDQVKIIRDKVILEVFKHVNFPKLAIDLERLGQAVSKGARNGSYLSVPLTASAEKRGALLAAWRGLLQQVDPKPIDIAIMASLMLDKFSEQQVFSLLSSKGKFSIVEKGDLLYWNENSPWPAAYSNFLDQLIAIIGFHNHLISQKLQGQKLALNSVGFEDSLANIVSEYPRMMPTEIHYAVASLGAWLGGATNIQYLSYYATIRQITYKSLNVTYAQRMEYSEREAENFHNSGIALVPLDLYTDIAMAQGDSLLFGSIPIDEFNFANVPSNEFMQELPIVDPQLKFPGLMLDKNYRASFWARKPSMQALLGANNILRDHYTDFYANLSIDSLVRCKHYCAPIVRVHSIDEMHSLIANIPLRSEDGIFFRGQGKLHLLNRSEEVRRMLFGDSCSIEPSLVTAASRINNYPYDDVHFALRLFLEQKIALQDQILGENRLKDWQEMVRSPLCKLDRAIMALAQHYGIPTHGLDITRDSNIATWFATNRYSKQNSIVQYETMMPESWPSSEDDWPVVIACQAVTHSIQGSLHECEELDQFGFAARRPTAQSAFFFQGGHSDHINRLAETVVCVFRLAPGLYETGKSFESLFPSPAEDEAYRVMLEFAQSRQFGSPWGHYINRFH